jgi:hypothetical protein
MSQISRPFQIALAAVALLALVWVAALHRPSSGSSQAPSSAESPARAVAPAGKPATSPSSGSGGSTGAGGSSVYHGSAPGVAGLSKAIAKAHGAVATSEQSAQQLQQKSEQASSNAPERSASAGGTPAPATKTSSHAAPKTSSHAAPKASSHAAPRTSSHAAPRTSSQSAAKAKPGSPASAAMPRQQVVERELAHGDVVALLFWSRKGSDDNAVHSALYQLARSERSLAVHAAHAKEVASFGTITRGIQVYGTPTLLLVGKHGRTLVLTGLQDAFAIRQAVSEVRHP